MAGLAATLVVASSPALLPGETAAATQQPAASVATRTASVGEDRNVQLLLRCNRSGAACRGAVALHPAGDKKTIGETEFRIPSGRARLVTVGLNPAGYTRLLAVKELTVEARATTRRATGKARTKRRSIVLTPQSASTVPAPSPTVDGGPATSPAEDRARAERIALKLSDLPSGWSAGSDDGALGSGCSIPGADGVSGRHPFSFFTTGLATSAGSDVSVLATVGDAQSAYANVPTTVNACFREIVGSTIDGAKVQDVSIKPLPSPGVGDRSEAFRIEIDANSFGLDFMVVVDVVHIQRERVFSVLLFSELLSPIDSGLKERLVGAVATRMISSGL